MESEFWKRPLMTRDGSQGLVYPGTFNSQGAEYPTHAIRVNE